MGGFDAGLSLVPTVVSTRSKRLGFVHYMTSNSTRDRDTPSATGAFCLPTLPWRQDPDFSVKVLV